VNGLRVGTATGVDGGSASGMLSLGGALQCVSGGCGGLSIGTAGGTGVVNAVGNASAAGVSGFNGYSIGVLNGGNLGADSSAQGSLVAGAGGLVSPTGTAFLAVGSGFGGGGSTQAGASATGTVSVSGGDISGYQFVSIGEAFNSGATTTGTVALTGGTLATGQALVAGRTVFPSGEANAHGTLRLSSAQVLMAPAAGGSFAAFGVASGGQATGRLIATDSDLTLGALYVGQNFFGSGAATGLIDLERSVLRTSDVFAGSGVAANATFQLLDSTMQVENAFTLGQGTLSLDDSLLDVGGAFSLGDAAVLDVDIDGLLRGDEYGAIDAALAMLDGVLNLTFDDLLAVSGLMTFDLIRSASADGITGDFDSVSFSGLPDGYFLTSGVVFDGVEVYRVQLARVPEPGTLLLLLGGLATLLVSRRRLLG
jgi:hypothetical protein